MEGTERCQDCKERIAIELMIVKETEDGPTIYCTTCNDKHLELYRKANELAKKMGLKGTHFS
jgi:hypothetical protein